MRLLYVLSKKSLWACAFGFVLSCLVFFFDVIWMSAVVYLGSLCSVKYIIEAKMGKYTIWEYHFQLI